MTYELKNPQKPRPCYLVRSGKVVPGEFWYRDTLKNGFKPDEGLIWVNLNFRAKTETGNIQIGGADIGPDWSSILAHLIGYGVYLSEELANTVVEFEGNLRTQADEALWDFKNFPKEFEK